MNMEDTEDGEGRGCTTAMMVVGEGPEMSHVRSKGSQTACGVPQVLATGLLSLQPTQRG